MPVVTKGGLVGRISAVSPLTAQIHLITREKVSEGGVIGELGTSNALGVVSGTGKKELLEMGYVPGSIEVQVGESVYTTGQEGIYPAGLKIGEIVEVRSGSATVPHQIFIKPSANFSSMQEVAVLFYEPPPRPEYDKALPNALAERQKHEEEKCNSVELNFALKIRNLNSNLNGTGKNHNCFDNRHIASVDASQCR